MDAGRIGLNKHHIKALIEIDVTEPRNIIKSKRALPGTKISFTSWIIKCIAAALSEHKEVHAFRKGINKLVIFNSIDISILIEKKVDGIPVPLPLVIRDANGKGLDVIYNEIENAKNKAIDERSGYVIGRSRRFDPLTLFALLPQFIRLFAWRIILASPHRANSMMGSAVVTSVGMAGNADGWIIPFSIHPVCFALGSIVKKPGVVNDTVEIREYLKMTILMDHDVVDGAPAARFVSRLVELIETGYGL